MGRTQEFSVDPPENVPAEDTDTAELLVNTSREFPVAANGEITVAEMTHVLNEDQAVENDFEP